MRWQTYALVCVLGGTMLLYGCVSEPTKRLNHQNEQAGAMVEQDPQAKPETRQAGSDVKLNSQAMARELGQPKEKVPYSPAESEKQRGQIPEKTWWERILGSAWEIGGAFLLGGGAFRVASTIFPAIAPFGAIAQVLVGAIAKGRTKAEAAVTGADATKSFLTVLESELVDSGWQGKVKKMAKAFEAEEEIKHTVTLR
jgi:hypothetical protein